MRCDEALERMMEADLGELLAEAESPLGDHLGSCRRCREIAHRIVLSERALAEDLTAATPVPDLDRILERAGAAGTESGPPRLRSLRNRILPGGPGERTAGDSPKPWTVRRWARAALPLAAAAAAATLFLPSTRSLPGDPHVPPPMPPGLDLEVPEGRTAAVLETKDPNITVLWFF